MASHAVHGISYAFMYFVIQDAFFQCVAGRGTGKELGYYRVLWVVNANIVRWVVEAVFGIFEVWNALGTASSLLLSVLGTAISLVFSAMVDLIEGLKKASQDGCADLQTAVNEVRREPESPVAEDQARYPPPYYLVCSCSNSFGMILTYTSSHYTLLTVTIEH